MREIMAYEKHVLRLKLGIIYGYSHPEKYHLEKVTRKILLGKSIFFAQCYNN